MQFADVMSQLEQWGTAQARKIYVRHGVQEPMFGVSYANLNQLKKQIKIDHALAQELWATGNHDARVLATMIADAKTMSFSELEAWSDDLNGHAITDAWGGLAGRTPHARALAVRWLDDDNEWKARASWGLIGQLAMNDADVADDFFMPHLTTIEQTIHQRQNRVREAMNTTLIAIGSRNLTLQARAIDVANLIGTVEVDHGETGCKTPDAIPYMQKTWEHKKSKEQRAKSKKV